MKKNFKKLELNKSTLSNLEIKNITGGIAGPSHWGCSVVCVETKTNLNPQVVKLQKKF